MTNPPNTDQTLDLDAIPELTRRLRGVYRIPITDGCGAVGGGDEPDNPDQYVRSFQTPPIQLRAADALDALTAEVRKLRSAAATALGNLDDPTGGEHVADMRAAAAVLREALKPKEPSA